MLTSKNVVLKPPVELWNINTQFVAELEVTINHHANLPTVIFTMIEDDKPYSWKIVTCK